jgi:hypothetical protein
MPDPGEYGGAQAQQWWILQWVAKMLAAGVTVASGISGANMNKKNDTSDKAQLIVMAEYVGNLGPMIGVYNQSQGSMVQDWW